MPANTVYLIITAMLKNFYTHLVKKFPPCLPTSSQRAGLNDLFFDLSPYPDDMYFRDGREYCNSTPNDLTNWFLVDEIFAHCGL
jgi:hypothetical protein